MSLAHQILARRRKSTQVCVRGINFADLWFRTTLLPVRRRNVCPVAHAVIPGRLAEDTRIHYEFDAPETTQTSHVGIVA